MKVEIVTNPATGVFRELVRTSTEQFLASPFIKASIAELILENRPSGAQISVLTSYKLANFYRNSSDIEALGAFLDRDVDVRNYARLHAKAYIFDSERALITSGNLTLGGLETNYECGVLIDDCDVVGRLRSAFLELFCDEEKIGHVTRDILATTQAILAKVPREKRIRFEKSEEELFGHGAAEQEDDLYDGGTDTIGRSLSGWRLDTFNVLRKLPGSVFRLEQVYASKDELGGLHPDNRNIEAKIRQQLQELRDLGVIEFLGGGVYRKLWKDG